MATVSRSTKISGGTTLSSNTLARAVDVETDILTLFNAHNNHDSGSSKWTVVSALNATATPLIADNSSGTNNIAEFKDNGVAVVTIADGGGVTLTGSAIIPTLSSTTATLTTATITTLTHTLAGYRRPNLKYISASLVDVEGNTGTLNQTTIVFPDGSVRSVTEDTASTNKYRRFDITVNAVFTSGTEDSGLRTTLSEAATTWYAIYAVKSQINAANFVLVGDTTVDTQANFATLNTAYGTNGWVFLGYIRNGGDGTASTTDIVEFVQAGAMTYFLGANTGGSPALTCPGIRLADTAGAVTLSYAYAAGTGNTNIPATITHVLWATQNAAVAGNIVVRNSADTRGYFTQHSNTAAGLRTHWSPASEGIKMSNGPASSIAYDIVLSGWVDGVLMSGSVAIL